MLLKDIENYVDNDANEETDLMSDANYLCKSCSLITESLQKGCDVMQLANGDIIVTELKAVTFKYSWDEKRNKLIRTQFGNKPKKTKPRKAKLLQAQQQQEQIAEFA
jgi:hypothetical protein